jgi:hypothetical protein
VYFVFNKSRTVDVAPRDGLPYIVTRSVEPWIVGSSLHVQSCVL